MQQAAKGDTSYVTNVTGLMKDSGTIKMIHFLLLVLLFKCSLAPKHSDVCIMRCLV